MLFFGFALERVRLGDDTMILLCEFYLHFYLSFIFIFLSSCFCDLRAPYCIAAPEGAEILCV